MKRIAIGLALLAVCVVVVFLVVGKRSGTDDPPLQPELEERLQMTAMEMDTPFITEGLKQPPRRAAADAELDGQAPVIGVSAGGHYRAYAVSAMSGQSSHVINDLIAERPVSVTYCDRTDCARVLAPGSPKTPGELMLGGWQEGEMLLMLDGEFYKQSAAEIPLVDYEFERTTWDEWRTKHPETDVFVGDSP